MKSAFLEDMAARLAERGVGTFRYQFPYMEQRRPRTDPPAVATRTVRAAVDAALGAMKADGRSLALVAGGKSFGGRMTAYAAADKPLRAGARPRLPRVSAAPAEEPGDRSLGAAAARRRADAVPAGNERRARRSLPAAPADRGARGAGDSSTSSRAAIIRSR